MLSATSRVLGGDVEAAAETNSDGGGVAPTPRSCRLELKVKSYDSVTDARAWSHKICKRSGLILDTIKRDYGPCPSKLIPTRVIVETLLAGKSKEITRLRRRIADLEHQLYATSDRGDATPHLGGDTRGESEVVSCDEVSIASATDSTFSLCYCLSSCDQATSTLADDDPGRLQQVIIRKDAKMAAMQNAIDILESDICEPYCVYAYINTTLEKIFAILKHNIDYRSYLESLSLEPTANMDLKGRIVIKLKVLEIFCEVLSPPSSHPEHANVNYFTQRIIQTNIYRNLNEKINTSVDVNDNENENSNIQSGELIAEIIEGDEMLRTLCRPPSSLTLSRHCGGGTAALMETPPNLLRVQQMQTCYAELVKRYELLEYEKSNLQSAVDACSCGDFQNELDGLRKKLKDYSILQEEKKRLERKIESLEERNATLSEELAYCTAHLLAEQEVNRITAMKLDNATDDNLRLEMQLEELKDDNQKELNGIQRKLEDQQYENANLLAQITSMKNNYEDKVCEMEGLLESMTNEILQLKTSIQNKEEQYNISQEQMKSNINSIKLLKEDLDYFRSSCKQVTDHNMTLETHINQLKIELDDAEKLNITLNDYLEKKENTMKLMSSKITNNAQEISQLSVELERNIEQKNVLAQQNIQFKDQLSRAENENKEIINILKLNEKDITKLNPENINDTKDGYRTLREAVKNLYDMYNAVCTENSNLKNELDKITKNNYDPRDLHSCPVPIQNEDILKEKKLLEKEHGLLLDTMHCTQNENPNLLIENKSLRHLNEQLLQLQNNYEILKKDNAFNKTVIAEKSNDIVCLNKTIERKNKDIKNLSLNLEKMKANFERLLSTQAEEKLSISKALDVSKKESSDLLKQIDLYENMNKHFTIVRVKLDKSISEKEAQIDYLQALCEEKEKQINNYSNLKNELVISKNAQYELCKKNDSLMKEVNTLHEIQLQHETEQQSMKRKIVFHASEYEKLKNENIRLKEQLKEICLNSSIQLEDLNLLKVETEKIKSENAEHVKNTSALNDKLNEYDNMILMLSEDLLRCNEKIWLLEQHEAELQSEILALHHDLDVALNSGEQLNTLHVTNTQSSINAIQTQYQNEILLLEANIARLTEGNLTSEKEIAVYRSKVEELDMKMRIIFAEMEQLMFKTKRETIAESEHGSIEWICESFKGIALLMEAQQSKNICLEQTLQKLQMSSQLLRSKADETINFIDKEKLQIESETTIKNIKEATLNKSTDTTLIIEPNANLEREQTEQEINIEFPSTQNKIQSDVERIKNLKNQLVDLKHAYESSFYTITRLRESNRMYINFQEKCTIQIEHVISSIESQSHSIRLLKLLVQKLLLLRKSMHVKLAHKNLQTDSDKEKSLNDITEVAAVTARDSMHSLTDDYKLSMSKYNGDNKSISQKSSDDVDQVRSLTSENCENPVCEITCPRKIAQSRENYKMNEKLNDKNHKSEILNDTNMSSDSNANKMNVVNKNYSNFFRIYDNDEEIENNSRPIYDTIDVEARQICISTACVNLSDVDNGNRSHHNETRHWNEELLDDVDDDTPTHDHHTGAGVEPEPCRSRSAIQRVMFCTDPSQMNSTIREILPYYLPDETRTYDLESDAAAVDAAADTINEEARTCYAEKPYLTERDMARRMGALLMQYERQMRRVAVEHEEGVKSLQRLHEQTVHDLTRVHEGEVARLRTRADILAAENARMLSAFPPIRECDQQLHIPLPLPTEESSDIEWRKAERAPKKAVRELGLSQTAVQMMELRPHSRRAGRQRRSTTPASAAPPCHNSRGHGRDTCPCQLPSAL